MVISVFDRMTLSADLHGTLCKTLCELRCLDKEKVCTTVVSTLLFFVCVIYSGVVWVYETLQSVLALLLIIIIRPSPLS